MAKGKRSSGNKYVSKGERPNVTRSVLNAIRREYITSDARLNNQVKAWRAGKNGLGPDLLIKLYDFLEFLGL